MRPLCSSILFLAKPLGHRHAPDLAGSLLPVRRVDVILQHERPLGQVPEPAGGAGGGGGLGDTWQLRGTD